MVSDYQGRQPGVAGDAADHVVEARRRARQMLGVEAHLGEVDDWRHGIVSARDALIIIWLLWLTLQGFGHPPYTDHLLIAMAFAVALLVAASTGRSTHSQVKYYESELERERTEIRENFEHERDEVRALYAAKGFREPLLEQIVDTLSADDDRLLKVMMEEELGLSMHHMHHPLLVGLWNFGGALAGGLIPALPLHWMTAEAGRWWVPLGGAGLLAFLAGLSARVTGRSMTEFFVSSVMMAAVTGGVAYYLSQWLSESIAM